jgi:hypothetical protein
MAFAKFMSSTVGRIVRIIAGLALIWLGFIAMGGTAGLIVGIIGIVPLAAGLLDVCLFAPLFGAPLSGKTIRAMK